MLMIMIMMSPSEGHVSSNCGILVAMITVGIDEVGRGCWAGPLVAGAVILREPIDGLRDSKKLSKKRRDALAIEIYEKAYVGLGWVTADEVDKLGLTKAVQLAMLRAMKLLHEQVEAYDEVIIDGNHNFFANVQGFKTENISTLIRADDLVPAVSAASIAAKVARDNYMAEISADYPDYKFDVNVGYGTAAHQAALKLHGVTILHRKSYKPIQALL
jgi:ribonuclease HII